MSMVLTVIVLCLLTAIYRLASIGRRPSGYPPGLPTLPLIGNLHQMASKTDTCNSKIGHESMGKLEWIRGECVC